MCSNVLEVGTCQLVIVCDIGSHASDNSQLDLSVPILLMDESCSFHVATERIFFCGKPKVQLSYSL